MTWIGLITLIIQVIRLAVTLWPLIRDALDAIDGMTSAGARFEARGRLADILRRHKQQQTCSVACASELQAFVDEISGRKA